MTTFRILGPVEAWRDERRLEIGGHRQLALLAFLVLHLNRPVSSEVLIEAVWGSQRDGATKRLQMAIARLRHALEPLQSDAESPLRTVSGGYLLSTAPGELDAEIFESLVQAGWNVLEDGQPEQALERLRSALALWRGPPLAEVGLEDFAQTEIRRLEELHLSALEARIEADLRLGHHAMLTGELESLLARHPMRERLAGQLMLALYRCGRQAEALAVYQRTRVYLRDELGLDPGPALKRLQTEILEQAPSLDAEPARGATASRQFPAPPRSPPIPSGTVTMLITDIERSTGLLQELGELYGDVLGRHNELIRAACGRREGVEIANLGDGLFFSFVSPRAALEAAREVQEELAVTSWPAGTEVLVRVGVHTGEPRIRGNTYWGEDVHYAARIADAANGGQVLVSAATAALVPEADLLDLGEHRVRDFPSARRLLQLGLADHPPPRTLDPLRSNLPTSPGQLIGRETESADLVELLRSGRSRLVTIIGAGGAGKTRLALAVAEALVEEFPDGAFFVPLAETGAVEGLPAAIAAPLHIRLVGASDPVERIAAALADRKLLLLLDNFEHLTESAAVISTLLAKGPELRVLVTSQAPLRLRSERVTALGPLSLPAAGTVAGVEDSPAGRLLVDRATEVAPHFRLTEENAEALADLCRALDGLPLAIELASARLTAISPKDLVVRVHEGIDTLGRGPRDLPARQRGLRAALEWTHELLDEQQATVLRRMGVFAGGASLERIERVCGNGIEVLEALAHLVDVSLVRRAGDGRFLLHETVRAFAHEKLAEAGETREIQSRHAAAFADAATAWGRRFLFAVDSVQATAGAEDADLGEALLWTSTEDPECFARLAGGAAMGLVLAARIARWRGLIEDALRRDVATAEGRAWLRLAGSLAALHGAELPLAHARVLEAIAAADESGDAWLACLMRTCSILNQTMGQPADDVRTQYSDLRKRVERLRDHAYSTLVDGIEPLLLMCEGRSEEAGPMISALMNARSRTDFVARMAVYDWPDCLLAAREYDRALVAHGVALRTARDRGETLIMAYQIDGIAVALCHLERYEQALEVAGAAESVHKTGGPIISTAHGAMLADILEKSRATFGARNGDAAYVRGRSLALDAAVNLALRLASGLPADIAGP